MPIDTESTGAVPKESPLKTHAILTWTMNFAAGCGDMDPRYFDNTKGRKPSVHPLFLPGTREVIGAWAALYSTGFTKEEAKQYTFAHHSFDKVFHRALQSEEIVRTSIQLVGLGKRRSGGRFVSRFQHDDEAGVPISTSWWGGVLLGYKDLTGEDTYLDGAQPPLLPTIACSGKLGATAVAGTAVTIMLPASQAFVWDACIRDPRNVKAASSDINVHTNMALAAKAGLAGRTLNGLSILAVCMPPLLKFMGRASWDGLQRIGGIFGAPVIMLFDAVEVSLSVTSCGIDEVGRDVVLFEVKTREGKVAIRDGYVVIANAEEELLRRAKL